MLRALARATGNNRGSPFPPTAQPPASGRARAYLLSSKEQEAAAGGGGWGGGRQKGWKCKLFPSRGNHSFLEQEGAIRPIISLGR